MKTNTLLLVAGLAVVGVGAYFVVKQMNKSGNNNSGLWANVGTGLSNFWNSFNGHSGTGNTDNGTGGGDTGGDYGGET